MRLHGEQLVNTLVKHFKGSTFPILSRPQVGPRTRRRSSKTAHKCVIEGADVETSTSPPKDDDKDVEGPAPGSRLALFQMLARYEKLDVNIAAMDKRTEEDDVIDETEKALKELEAEMAAAEGGSF